LDVEPTDRSDEYVLKVRCSSGTYVRTLCADIGAALGCGGAMAALDRHVAGRFTLADAVDLDTLRAETDEQRLAHLLPLEQLFADLPALSLPAFYSRLCKNGCTIRLSKLRASHPEGQLVRLLDPDGVFFALGLVVSVTGEDGASTYLAVRAEKFFVLEKGDASNA
jgi:tRNA pseudouridine55 synthase